MAAVGLLEGHLLIIELEIRQLSTGPALEAALAIGQGAALEHLLVVEPTVLVLEQA